MNKDLKNGLLVAGGAILLFLLYKKSTKEAVKEQPNAMDNASKYTAERGVGVALPIRPSKEYAQQKVM